jgi:hypothetical protein
MFEFIKLDEEPDGPDGQDDHIMIMQIHQVKTSKNKTVWGREEHTRKNVSPGECTTLYSFQHFEVTQEEFDFKKNGICFCLKLFVSSDRTSSLDKDMLGHFYGKMLQNPCGELCHNVAINTITIHVIEVVISITTIITYLHNYI